MLEALAYFQDHHDEILRLIDENRVPDEDVQPRLSA